MDSKRASPVYNAAYPQLAGHLSRNPMSATQPTRNNPKVFCSHRLIDKPRVREVARKLREAGIDAWLDEWEINPGDDIVAAMNRGLASYDVGLIFFSNEVQNGKWMQAEISTLTLQAIEDGKSVIPVMLDSDVPIPPLLRPRCRIGWDQIDQLIDAIYGRSGRPSLGPPRAGARQRRFVIHLRRAGQAELAVRAELDGTAVADEQPVRLGADFAFSYADFLHLSLPGARQSAEALSVERDRHLHRFGDAIGRVLFHDGIERALADLLDQASKANEAIELIVETQDAQLLTIPFEAARLSDGRTPALEIGVRMLRRLAAAHSGSQSPQPGPLKILVAVGAPDEGKTANAVLDMERELQTILDAIENARQYGNAYVRILDVGSLDQIRSSLKEQAYHVLHLSSHGNAGVLELEDEDGNPVPVRAADLAAAIRDSGHPAPLIFLASCLSGAGDSETVSLAQNLLQQGAPAVLAMQTSVTDKYSTNLAATFYTNLSISDRPLASQALALGRQQLERDRRKALERGEHVPSEYATPSFFCTGDETPILDRALEFVRPLEHTRKLTGGAVPMLSIGDLIGRRVELRRVMCVLTDDQRSIAEIGRKAGCQLLGIGGVGKSAIAGRAMARLSDDGWTCIAITGPATLSELATTISAALLTTGDPAFKDVGLTLAQPLADEVRLKVIANLLVNHPLLLVLDNFEDNLTLGGERFLDPATAQIMQLLYRSAQRGKLLITSRYPLPEASEWLATEEPGPLSPAQTGKLMLRLSALPKEPESVRLIQRAIGGHPRMLEYLDAILKRGKSARVTNVARSLNEQAKRQGLNLADASATLGAAVRAALQVGAGDILLDELLELVAEHEGDLDALHQLAVFPRPVSVEGLAFCLAGGRAAVQEQIVQVRGAVERIVQASLLTRTLDESVWVHRWTAEVLRSRIAPEAYRECCRRGGEYLTSRQRSIVEGLEATRLFLAAEQFDRAAQEGVAIVQFLKTYGQVADLAAVTRELVESLPEDHPDHYVFLGTEADALKDLGLSTQALTKYQRVVQSLEERVRAYPDRADFLRDLSVSYNKMGDLLRALGQGEQARAFFQKSLDLRERLARQEPDRADFLRDLSVSYNKMGDLLRGLGQGEQARAFFQKSLDIRERLARREPDRADFLRDLSVSYERMGDLLRALGQGEQARSFFQKSLDIRERLAQQEPDRADFLRDLSVSYNNIGDLLRGLGQGEQARAFSRRTSRLPSASPARNPIAPTSCATSPSPTTKWAISCLASARASRPAPFSRSPWTFASASPARNPIAPTSCATSPSPMSAWAISCVPSARASRPAPFSRSPWTFASASPARNPIAPTSCATSPSPMSAWAISCVPSARASRPVPFSRRTSRLPSASPARNPIAPTFRLIWLSRSIASAIIDRCNGHLTSSGDSIGSRS